MTSCQGHRRQHRHAMCGTLSDSGKLDPAREIRWERRIQGGRKFVAMRRQHVLCERSKEGDTR